MKGWSRVLGVLSGFMLMIVVLFFSIGYVVYEKDGYFEAEYTKYDVLSDVQMEMDDLLYVTDEMMQYLCGERADLVINTVVDGQARTFFNEKEIRHMADVQGLFLAGLRLRTIGIVFMIGSCLFCFWKRNLKTFLTSLEIGMGTFFAAVLMLAMIISTNFTKYFTIFHEIFFNNEDWILDPQTDLLIRIVPEGFFFDTVYWIVGIFCVMVFIIWIGLEVIRRKIR